MPQISGHTIKKKEVERLMPQVHEDHKMKDCRVTSKLCVHCREKDKHH